MRACGSAVLDLGAEIRVLTAATKYPNRTGEYRYNKKWTTKIEQENLEMCTTKLYNLSSDCARPRALRDRDFPLYGGDVVPFALVAPAAPEEHE